MKYPEHLIKLMQHLKKLPGVGSKSAERFAFNMLNWSPEQILLFSQVIVEIPIKLQSCSTCGCLMGETTCELCSPSRKERFKLCIIASPKDAYAIEATGEYRGLYHVMGGLLSPMDGFLTEKLNLNKLKKRIQEDHVTEVIIALDSTLEGDTTSLFLKEELQDLNLTISRIGFGLPMGSNLDYVDGSTLARALLSRSSF